MKKLSVLVITFAVLSLASCGTSTSTQTKPAAADSVKVAVKADTTKAACCIKKDSTKQAVKVDSVKK